jgi:hypothetical protein
MYLLASRSLLVTCLVGIGVGLGACSGSSEVGGGPSGEQDITRATTFLCTGLGNNDNVYLQVTATLATATPEWDQPFKGSVVPNPSTQYLKAAPDAILFGSWTPAGGFFNQEILEVPKSMLTATEGTIKMWSTQSYNYWPGNCHKATAAELSGDHCLAQSEMKYFGPIDSQKKASIAKQAGGYRATITDAKNGDFVWDIKTTTAGLTCKIGDITPVSCSAVVADKIGEKSREDGSSAGAPYLHKVSNTEYTGGIHDPESGEFAYTITTDGSADHCKVTSITAKPGSQGAP